MFQLTRRRRDLYTASPEVTAPVDPLGYADTKRLGIFAVQYVHPGMTINGKRHGARVTPMYATAGVIARADTNLLELHLRKGISLEGVGPCTIRQSLGLVAAYAGMHQDQMRPSEIVGITDPFIGKIAKRFGFALHDIDASSLPMVVAAGIDELGGRADRPREDSELTFRPGSEPTWNADRRPYANFGHFVVAHMDMPEFIERFGGFSERSIQNAALAA